MSYGMLVGGALDNLQAIAGENNIHISYVNTIRTVDNYIPGFDIEKQIDKHLKLIVDDIKSGKQWIRKSTFIGKFMTKKFSDSDKFGTGIGVTNTFIVEDAWDNA